MKYNTIKYAEDSYNYVKDGYNYASEKAWTALDYLLALKWIVNFWLIGIPYTVYCILAIIWNLWWNIEFNHMWAQGNVVLLASSIYLIV